MVALGTEILIQRSLCTLSIRRLATCRQSSGIQTRISRLQTLRPHDRALSPGSHSDVKTPTLRTLQPSGMRSPIATLRRHCPVVPPEMALPLLGTTLLRPIMEGEPNARLSLRCQVRLVNRHPTGLRSECARPAAQTFTTTITDPSHDATWECTPCRLWTTYRCLRFQHIWPT